MAPKLSSVSAWRQRTCESPGRAGCRVRASPRVAGPGSPATPHARPCKQEQRAALAAVDAAYQKCYAQPHVAELRRPLELLVLQKPRGAACLALAKVRGPLVSLACVTALPHAPAGLPHGGNLLSCGTVRAASVPLPPQVYLLQAGEVVLAADPSALNERPVLDALLRALRMAAKGWLDHASAQCLVRRRWPWNMLPMEYACSGACEPRALCRAPATQGSCAALR